MGQIRSQLPPMTTLAAFEASARLRSFTRAAEELFITQAAVSRQIRILEDHLGVKLFDRTHRRIELTEPGQQFQHAVSVALDLLANSAGSIRAEDKAHDLTLGADLSMAHLWLMPRFPDFQARFPEISVNIKASDAEEDCLKPGIDMALLYGDGNWPGFDARLLVAEEIYPVCTPEYLKKNGPISDPVSFLEHILLDLRGDRWDWVDWHQWLTKKDIPLSDDMRSLGFNNLPLLVQAACAGQGIALGWDRLFDRYLESGELVVPLDMSLRTGRGYFLVKRSGVKLTQEATTLENWIVESS
ncbi:MAG: LysR substrate-binding domain-containing protein [Pseudomonadota bacterium]